MATKSVIDWKKLESFIDLLVPLNIKIFLDLSGYDSLLSLKRINEEKIDKIEIYLQNDGRTLAMLDENDKTTSVYKSQNVFNILPGHRNILLALPEFIENMFHSIDTVRELEAETATNSHNQTSNQTSDDYTVILSKLIETANKNKNKSKNAYKYDDIVKNFSTYIFLLCGRTCYETLNKNLPIPSTKTIC